MRTTTNLQTRKQVGGERRKSQETRNTLSSEAAYKLLKRFRSNIKEIANAINNKDIKIFKEIKLIMTLKIQDHKNK